MQRRLFEGTCVALVTPFKKGKVDFDSMQKLIEMQLKGGVSAISVLGTTGEPCTLSEKEKQEIVKFCAKVISGRAKYIVGSGGNNTKEVLSFSQFACENGADGLLVVTPYYNKCTQNGLVKHFHTIANFVKTPIIVYNVPSRTGLNVLPTTLEKIAENEYIFGFKQASGNMDENLEILKNLKDKIAIYSGEDSLNFVFYSLGASGTISVTANAFPYTVSLIYQKVRENNFSLAQYFQEKLFNINKLLFSEVSPIPIKECLHFMELCENEVRAPLTQMENNIPLLQEIENLKKAGIT